MFRFHIQRELRHGFATIVSDHANLFLSPLRSQIRSATISLHRCETSPNPSNQPGESGGSRGTAIYTCAIKISGFDAVTCDHPDPALAIGQAMARARRMLARRAQTRDHGGL